MADPARPTIDRVLDETIEETFPASDAPANTVETGIRVGEIDGEVTDNRPAHRFELTIDGETAFLAYERTDDALRLVHTEVPPALRGRQIGDRLVEAALGSGRSAGLKIIAVCPFVRAYLRKHPR